MRGTEAAAHVCAAAVCTSPKSRKIGIMSKITFVWKLTVFSNRSRRGDGPAPTRECSSPDGTGPPDRTRRRYRRALSRRSHGRPRWRPLHARPRAPAGTPMRALGGGRDRSGGTPARVRTSQQRRAARLTPAVGLVGGGRIVGAQRTPAVHMPQQRRQSLCRMGCRRVHRRDIL